MAAAPARRRRSMSYADASGGSARQDLGTAGGGDDFIIRSPRHDGDWHTHVRQA